VAQILVRNVDEKLKSRLQQRAKRNGRSMEAEVREILRHGLKDERQAKRALGSEIVALFSGQGIGLEQGEEIRELRGFPIKPIRLDE
jgi:plasmid stability protein